ncbi:hypothetical protein M422DRAFT_260037 [Sphaerobolus stellatus SS14]|uniref:Peptidase A1 domain-containing protein n=1 Tax=Sphaerobolus stellatus (strain SS14) TaxID=990650 RepID=A0A0C9VJ87_SPHS4|nr:hypothetical protein M422DRAFT_260037 [Sphaerobolus stellatus SS14]
MADMALRLGRDDEDGAVLNMTLSGNPVWSAVYSITVQVGQSNQTISLSVDTGSSDLWIATKDCSTSECSNSHATLYDPSNAVQSGQTGNLFYLQGNAQGPIVWDSIAIGPYNLPHQALVAAHSVTDEILSPNFVGLLGLALPPISAIADLIPPTLSDAPDGATVQQNIYGSTPIDTAPARHFIGITLERQESFVVPSLLTIGKHPADSIPNFNRSKIGFLNLVSSEDGDTYWRVPIGSITAWVDGQPRPIALNQPSVVPSSFSPVAILDTGGSPILTTRNIANAIYGAFDVSPAADGNYYLPCTTPMNLTIGLGNLPPIPIHPLDLTSLPLTLTAGANTSTCMGLIQAYDNLGTLSDMILGVTFMRNVYTVLSSEPVGANSSIINPQLGLFPLTNATQAMDDFHRVRVLGQTVNPGSSNLSPISASGGKKISVGLIVLFAILGFFGLCGALFGLRWCCLRKKFNNEDDEGTYYGDGKPEPSKDETELQEGPFLASFEKDRSRQPSISHSTRGSDHTRVDEDGIPKLDRSSSRSGSWRNKVTPNPEEGETDYFDSQDNTMTRHGHTPSSSSVTGLTTFGPVDASDHSPRIRDSAWDRSLALGVTSFENAPGTAGIGSRTSITSLGPTIRYVPRPRPVRDGSSGSQPTNRPWTTVEVGSRVDADLTSLVLDGLVPGPSLQVEDMVRGRSLSLADDSWMAAEISHDVSPAAGVVEKPLPAISSGGHVRTRSEGQLFLGHHTQPSGGVEPPLPEQA